MKQATYTRLLSALLAWIMLLTLAAPAMAEESAVATTMQLMKTTGTVSVTNNRGKDVKVFEKMRLYNGYKIATGESSYSWISLDSAKLVKEDACSEIKIQKSGKKLDILLDSGALFFNVTEPLEDDESLNIRTSTMSVGIRGTCGWVRVKDKWTIHVYLLEGLLEASVTDPVTGQVKTAEITGGIMAECVVYPQDQPGDKCDILIRRFTEEEIPGFVLAELVRDEPLCGDIYDDSGLVILPLRDTAEDRLKQDEEELRNKWAEIEDALREQDHDVSEDPVWLENVPVTDRNTQRNDADLPFIIPASPTERTMKIYDEEAQEMLEGASTVRLLHNPSPTDDLTNTLEVDSGLTVPAGKSLALESGIQVEVYPNQSLRVDGTMNVEGGNAVNRGNLTVTSSNTLHVAENLFNQGNGVMTVTATGRVVVDGTFDKSSSSTVNLTAGAKVLARSFNLVTPIDGWKVSDTKDAAGYYTLVRSGEPDFYTVTFTGTVTDSRRGTPLAGAAVTIIQNGSKISTATTGPDGTYTIPAVSLKGGSCTVEVSADGYRTSSEDVSITKDETITMDFLPVEEGDLSYTVKYVDQDTNEELDSKEVTGQTYGDAVTENAIDIAGYNKVEPTSQEIMIEVENEDVVFYYTKRNDLSYTVKYLDEDGHPLADPKIVENKTFGETYTETAVAVDGYTVDEQTKSVTVTIGTDEIIFNYTRQSVSVYSVTFSGTVTVGDDDDKMTLPGATIKISRDGEAVAEGSTDSEGKYSVQVEGLRDGNYTITAAAGENTTGSADAAISGDDTIERDIHLNLPEGDAWDWAYDEATRTLSIWGNTAMPDFSTPNPPNTNPALWREHAAEVKTVKVSGMTSIGNYAFNYCGNLETVTIPDSVISVGRYAFYGCNSLNSISIPDGVTSIENGTFYGCSDLTSISIPDGVSSIEDSTFYNCSGLTSISIPDGVTSIGPYAFYGCSGLNSISIPDGVSSIEDSTFYNCSGLTSISIPNEVTSIGKSAFYGCSSLNSIYIPDGVSSIGERAFYGCSGLNSISIPDGVSSIEDYTFYGCSGLNSISIPDGITSIGRSAFYGCSGLTSISIPEGITSIGPYAFYGCRSLNSISIPEGVTSIEDYTFYGCRSLNSISIPEGVANIGDYAFRDCSGLNNISIPEEVTSIGENAFENCSSLTSISIPKGVASIGGYAFWNCNRLTSISIPEGVTSIEDGTFYGCSDLTSISIPEGVTSIGKSAFMNCFDLTSISIPEGVTSIGEDAFAGCNRLTSINIPEGVTSIGKSAFWNCNSLTSISIPEGVTSIGNEAFYSCSRLTSISIPERVTSIGDYTFYDCTFLTSISIPEGVTSIGDYAFRNCRSLANVYYSGTEEQWNRIEIGTNNTELTNATIHYAPPAPDGQSLFLLSNSPAPTYTDVPAGAWYAEAVAYCRTYGLMDGTGDGTFSPGAPMTRAMLAAALYRTAGSPAVTGSSGFSDVEPGSWSDAPIAWAVRAKLMNGYGGGVFGGGDTVTREQFAAVLWRWQDSPETEAEAFADASQVSGWATGAVDWARSGGMMGGVGGNRFDPKGETTRAQAAMLLMNYNRKFGAASIAVMSAMDVMCEPSGILALEDGSLLVTDTYHKMIWQVTEGVSTVYAGGETVADPYGKPIGGYNDAAPEDSYFKEPWAVAPFRGGWAVSDAANGAVRLITPEQTQTVNGRTMERLRLNALGVAFDRPTGLAADEEGNLYVADTDGGVIRKITPENGDVTTIASGLAEPMGLCWANGALYAAETGANRIIRIENGKTTVVAGGGEGYEDGPADRAAFCAPEGLTAGPDGTLYVADTGNNAVRQIRGGEVTTLAVREKFRADGYPISPRGLLVRGDTLYVCDNFGRKVLILSLG